MHRAKTVYDEITRPRRKRTPLRLYGPYLLAVMIPLPERALPKGVTHVRVEGHDMQVLEVVSPDRWTIYHVRRHRV